MVTILYDFMFRYLILELYLNGIQRASFIPCIELIKSSLKVIHLSSSVDYRDRKINKETMSRFFHPINAETGEIMCNIYKKLCESDGPLVLNVMGRTINVSKGRIGTCAQFTFSELFEESKSATDYIKICESFPKIFVTGIPRIGGEKRNEIRRFITFIDQVYEFKVNGDETK